MLYAPTAYNKRYTLRRGQAPHPGFRSARSLHSHASLHPHFATPGLATQALIRAGKTSYTWNVMRNKTEEEERDAPPSMAAQNINKMEKKEKKLEKVYKQE